MSALKAALRRGDPGPEVNQFRVSAVSRCRLLACRTFQYHLFAEIKRHHLEEHDTAHMANGRLCPRYHPFRPGPSIVVLQDYLDRCLSIESFFQVRRTSSSAPLTGWQLYNNGIKRTNTVWSLTHLMESCQHADVLVHPLLRSPPVRCPIICTSELTSCDSDRSSHQHKQGTSSVTGRYCLTCAQRAPYSILAGSVMVWANAVDNPFHVGLTSFKGRPASLNNDAKYLAELDVALGWNAFVVHPVPVIIAATPMTLRCRCPFCAQEISCEGIAGVVEVRSRTLCCE